MIRSIILAVACVAALAATSGQVKAAMIYNNGLAANNSDSGYYSSQLRNWRVYDDFTLGSNSTLTDVFFQMGLTSGPFNGSFSFSIYNNLGGNNIGTLIHTEVLTSANYTATLNTISSFPFGPFYDITFELAAPKSLAAGNYAVSFYGLGAMDFRTPNTGTGNSFYQQFGGGFIDTRSGNSPFAFFDNSQSSIVVPGPSSFVLLGIGACFAGVGGVRRRRREATQRAIA